MTDHMNSYMNTMNTIVICHDLIWEVDNYGIHMYSWGFLNQRNWGLQWWFP
jgi:hypothetical protein